jgi:hypothetical protein
MSEDRKPTYEEVTELLAAETERRIAETERHKIE